MKKFLVGLGIFLATILVLFVVVAFMVIGLRNQLVMKEEEVNNAWSKVETQYQRRYDLIPNLVESVKGYMEQEDEIFLKIADARTRYANADSGSQAQIDAANDLESSFGRLLVIIEDYPELKSDTVVTDLMTELEGTENRIAVERNRYNDEVTEFNKMIKIFPNNVINDLFLQFDAKERFESIEGSDVAPTVDLSDEDESTNTEETDNSMDQSNQEQNNAQ
ncbi:LemA family protein [Candidatus Dojkabacteria bacterium]|nr:LemA family protein [Candidatus Dojkabacteria bacterium]